MSLCSQCWREIWESGKGIIYSLQSVEGELVLEKTCQISRQSWMSSTNAVSLHNCSLPGTPVRRLYGSLWGSAGTKAALSDNPASTGMLASSFGFSIAFLLILRPWFWILQSSTLPYRTLTQKPEPSSETVIWAAPSASAWFNCLIRCGK
jgi:hypothetical protein